MTTHFFTNGSQPTKDQINFEIQPQTTLSFHFQEGKLIAFLKIYNKMVDKYLYFKIRTTARTAYVVRPIAGILEPLSSTTASVILVSETDLEARMEDKFLVQLFSERPPNRELTSKEISDNFTKLEKTNPAAITQRRLQVQFESNGQTNFGLQSPFDAKKKDLGLKEGIPNLNNLRVVSESENEGLRSENNNSNSSPSQPRIRIRLTKRDLFKKLEEPSEPKFETIDLSAKSSPETHKRRVERIVSSGVPQEVATVGLNSQEVRTDQYQKHLQPSQREELKEAHAERESNSESYLTENRSHNMSILNRSKMSDTGIYYRNKCVQLESKEKKQNIIIKKLAHQRTLLFEELESCRVELEKFGKSTPITKATSKGPKFEIIHILMVCVGFLILGSLCK